MDCSPQDSPVHGDSPGQNTGVGCHPVFQGIFPTQGSNPCHPHCRQILYHLSYQGSPRILEWVAYPFSGGSSRPRNRTGVSCIAGGFFTSWAGPLVMLGQGILLAGSGLSSEQSEQEGWCWEHVSFGGEEAKPGSGVPRNFTGQQADFLLALLTSPTLPSTESLNHMPRKKAHFGQSKVSYKRSQDRNCVETIRKKKKKSKVGENGKWEMHRGKTQSLNWGIISLQFHSLNNILMTYSEIKLKAEI